MLILMFYGLMIGKHDMRNYNTGTKYGRRKFKKEYNAYAAAEAKKGNYAPAIISFLALFIAFIIVVAVQGIN